jgi:4-hydroxybenzoate polyprenyltransferase
MNKELIYQKLKNYAFLMRLNRPIGIYLLLWPTLWALWIVSHGKPQIHVLVIFILGVIILRSAGCVMNDIADRDFDRHVMRTKDRPLTTGKITLLEAYVLLIFLLAGGLLIVLFLNMLTIVLAIIGALLLLLYPFLKRYTHWPQFGLGLAFSWGIPMASAAQSDTIFPIVWLVFIASLIWTMVYDTQYAMVDRADDKKIGIKSTAILFGHWDRLIIGVMQSLFLTLILLIGWLSQYSFIFYIGWFLAVLFASYQQYLIKDRNPTLCFKAFLNNQWVGLIIFLALVGSVGNSIFN